MQGVDWGALRSQLGPEFGYRVGHWFCVDHAVVVRRTGRPFSYKAGGDGRRVVLATRPGPNATLFARSASYELGVEHSAHLHDDAQRNTCRLNLPGWIDLRVPVGVPTEALNDDTLSCEEPESSELYSLMETAAAI